MESVKHIINENNKKNCYLLEINTNPGLEESSPFIQKIVPRMIIYLN